MKRLTTIAVLAAGALAAPAVASADVPLVADCPAGTESGLKIDWPAREVPLGRTVYISVSTNYPGPSTSIKHHMESHGDTSVIYEGDNDTPEVYWLRFDEAAPDTPGWTTTATLTVSWTQWPSRTYTPGQSDCRMSESATFVVTPRVAPDHTDPYVPPTVPVPVAPTPPVAPGPTPPELQPPTLVCKVPNVKGMTVARASERLAAAHCRRGSVRRVRSRTRVGRVVTTSPGRGMKLTAGTRVRLTISGGR
jgi:hypothetical protein